MSQSDKGGRVRQTALPDYSVFIRYLELYSRWAIMQIFFMEEFLLSQIRIWRSDMDPAARLSEPPRRQAIRYRNNIIKPMLNIVERLNNRIRIASRVSSGHLCGAATEAMPEPAGEIADH